MRTYRVLLVDDDPLILHAIGAALTNEGYDVTTAGGGQEALEILSRQAFDLVIADLVMDAVDGIAVLRRAKELNSETAAMVLTGYADVKSAIDALRLDADEYLMKPCEPEEILVRVALCIEKYEFKKKVKFYEELLPVCCECKKIRDDVGKEPGAGQWMHFEEYIWKRAGMKVTSTYCPSCASKKRKDI